MTTPPQGQMYLFDSATPPLLDGNYQLTTTTSVTYAGGPQPFTLQNYFDIVGPRFTVPQSMVAGTYPPADSHGEYQTFLPHIVLSRRTLPWEREIALPSQLPAPSQLGSVAPLPGPPPWVALLLFEEGEYTLNRNVPLQQAVPAGVYAQLGSPSGISCDSVTASLFLVQSILPSIEELQLLAHVRQVNVDDRELNTAGGDGYFAVVVSNRLPQEGGQYRACLVSLEGRTDILSGDPGTIEPGTGAGSGTGIGQIPIPIQQRTVLATRDVQVGQVERDAPISTTFTLSQPPVHTFSPPFRGIPVYPIFNLQTSLVVLTSWKFTCEGPGPFRKLMQNLDDAMFGTVQDIGHPAMSDTGHLQINLDDRLGATEQVWYRGPLVPWQLTRDNLGPYHSADQCRRVTPETGAEDISYAAAFEVGRLLAAADPRLARALMSWRRESYKQSARASTIGEFNSRLPLGLPASLAQQLHTPIVPLAQASAVDRVVLSGPIIADAHGFTQVAQQPGLQAAQVAQAWKLASAAEAQSILSGTGGALGAAVEAPAQTPRANTTLSIVAADSTGLERLTSVRTQTIQNATSILENS